ncbi:LPS translocon maturation chaperone LptM [Pasteurella atlantica]|nr:lipoprotein [Pasteurella atlantica]MDP8098932.1 lipoprotein [Pasteurella atlantica]MDP8106959.1 lipoprotein [Pasteurella atlantica]MDP8116649.1 lipoprotein [Pasteurella atlantica]
MKKWIIILMFVMGLTACGVKGSLYFPTEPPQHQTK